MGGRLEWLLFNEGRNLILMGGYEWRMGRRGLVVILLEE